MSHLPVTSGPARTARVPGVRRATRDTRSGQVDHRRIAAPFTGLSAAFTAMCVALAAPAAGQTTTEVPCGGARWGTCDTRATDNGYQYRYRGQLLEEVPTLGEDSGWSQTTYVDCGNDCPPDPEAVCALLGAVGPSPEMTDAARAEYDDLVEGCDDEPEPAADGLDVGDVQDALADYLREEALPTPTVVIQPSGNSVANLATILYTPVPEAFTFDVAEPVLATISAVPHYRWEFGDGEIGPDAPGRPYDPAIPPRDFPESYVSHAYRQPGIFQVTLTVTWAGTFTLPGAAEAFELPSVVLAAAEEIVVDEASGVLTDND